MLEILKVNSEVDHCDFSALLITFRKFNIVKHWRFPAALDRLSGGAPTLVATDQLAEAGGLLSHQYHREVAEVAAELPSCLLQRQSLTAKWMGWRRSTSAGTSPEQAAQCSGTRRYQL